MQRLYDWLPRLNSYVEAHRNTSFEWGTHDCCTFAAGVIWALTMVGVDVPRVRDKYHAARELNARGGIESAMDATGFPRWGSPLSARRGDIVLVNRALGVCLGHVWAAPGRDGLVFGAMDVAAVSWRVG